MTSLLPFILIMGFLIMAHELGHFFSAKALNIEVEEFGFGYPPRLIKLFSWKGTLFSLNWIPFGGFVRFKGEKDPTMTDSLSAAPKWSRFGALIGGPMTSLMIGVLLFSIVFSQLGNPRYDQVIISGVSKNSPAANAGIQNGDLILEVAGIKIKALEDISRIVQLHIEQPIEIVMKRAERTFSVTMIPRMNPPEGEGALGIIMTNPIQPVNLLQAIPQAVNTVLFQGKQLLTLPFQLMSGALKTSDVRLLSPKGIFDIYEQVTTSESSQSSWTAQFLNIIWFFAVLSSALGFTNLLPIPGLDGGYLFFLLPELILNKRVPPKLVNTVHFFGFILLVILMAFIFIQDFINPVALP
jgi:regulator of sigma E protease